MINVCMDSDANFSLTCVLNGLNMRLLNERFSGWWYSGSGPRQPAKLYNLVLSNNQSLCSCALKLMLLCKAKRQYLLTFQVSSYCFFAFAWPAAGKTWPVACRTINLVQGCNMHPEKKHQTAVKSRFPKAVKLSPTMSVPSAIVTVNSRDGRI